jgi:hypothetical protein
MDTSVGVGKIVPGRKAKPIHEDAENHIVKKKLWVQRILNLIVIWSFGVLLLSFLFENVIVAIRLI